MHTVMDTAKDGSQTPGEMEEPAKRSAAAELMRR